MTRVGLNGRLKVKKLEDNKKKNVNKVALATLESRLDLRVRAVCLSQFCLAQKKNGLNACVRIMFFCLYDYIVDLKLKNTVNEPSTAIKVLS